MWEENNPNYQLPQQLLYTYYSFSAHSISSTSLDSLRYLYKHQVPNMDAVIDLTDRSKALDLLNIRKQLM